MRCIEPTIITQGEQVEWTRSFSGYPATEWTLEYRFRGGGPGADVETTASGSGFAATLTASQSEAFVPGTYQWQAWVTEIADANNKIKVGSGSVTIERGFASGETGDIDLRSPAKIMLDTLDAALLASGSDDIVEYEITAPVGGRRVKRESRVSVLSLRKYYADIVSRENAAAKLKNGGRFGKSVKARMFSQ